MSNDSEENPLICFCFNVTKQEIIDVIVSHHSQDIWALTQQCKAGNGCTTCWADLQDLLQQYGQAGP